MSQCSDSPLILCFSKKNAFDLISLMLINFCWFHDDKFQNHLALNYLTLVNLINIISYPFHTQTLVSSKLLNFETLNMSSLVISLPVQILLSSKNAFSPVIIVGLPQISLAFGRICCSPIFLILLSFQTHTRLHFSTSLNFGVIVWLALAKTVWGTHLWLLCENI